MKSVLCETENVKKAYHMTKKMMTKKGADMVLIYGYPGTGKSHFALKNFAQHGWSYYRISTMDTAKSFLREIFRSLSFELHGGEINPKGDGATVAREVFSMFQDLTFLREKEGHPFAFVIDEVNLAIQNRKWQILELIRDFRDIAQAKVIMIGEEDTKDKIEKYNSHFFSRCSNFCKFDIVNSVEMHDIISRSTDVGIEKDVLTMICKQANGNLHDLECKIKDIEQIAKSLKTDKITMKEIIEATKYE